MPKTHCVATRPFHQWRVPPRFHIHRRRAVTKSTITVAVVLLALFFAGHPTYAQSAADIRYCADHPSDSTRCVPPAPGRPAIPKPAPQDNKMLGHVNTPNPCPGCSTWQIPKLAPANPPATQPVPASTQAWRNIQQQAEAQQKQQEINEQIEENNRIRLQQRQAQQQQNDESAYQAGVAVGDALAVLHERHRADSYCKKNLAGAWKFADGSVTMCYALLHQPVPEQITAHQERIADRIVYCGDHPDGSITLDDGRAQKCSTEIAMALAACSASPELRFCP